ncbi:MAG: hypothetical protein ABJB34_06595, partial [Acidobacteriota bacterium]
MVLSYFSGPTKRSLAAEAVTRTVSGKLFFDSFDRAALGSSYAAEGGDPSAWSISGNRVEYNSSGAGQSTLRQSSASFAGDLVYEATFNVSGASGPVTARLQAMASGNNFYYFDSHFNESADIIRFTNGLNTGIVDAVGSYAADTDYRVKMRVGSSGAGNTALWINEALIGSGTDGSPLTASGNPALWVADFGAGVTVLFDNLAVYSSTKLAVNGSFGSWALLRNDGATLVGVCNTAAVVDYGTVTSFPADYPNGPSAQLRVWPAGDTTCSGAAAASFTGTAGAEIFGGDVFTYADQPGGDTTPPARSNGQPTGSLPSGTTTANISLATDENATCRYGATAGVSYANLPNAFTNTGGTIHSTQVNGLSGGNTYRYYVRCSDQSANVNTDDFVISFSVFQGGDPFQTQTLISNLTAPLIMNFLPDGRILIGEKGGIIKVVPPGQTKPLATPVLTLQNLYTG